MKTFEITSGTICITDPCYKKETWCAAWNLPAKNGTWIAQVEYIEFHGKRVSKLHAYHKDADLELPTEILNADLGVDSGQLGIFDYAKYPVKDEIEKNSEYGEFYDEACHLTLGKDRFGVFAFGIVCSSGLGDGSYVAEIIKKYDEIISVSITFIED